MRQLILLLAGLHCLAQAEQGEGTSPPFSVHWKKTRRAAIVSVSLSLVDTLGQPLALVRSGSYVEIQGRVTNSGDALAQGASIEWSCEPECPGLGFSPTTELPDLRPGESVPIRLPLRVSDDAEAGRVTLWARLKGANEFSTRLEFEIAAEDVDRNVPFSLTRNPRRWPW